MPKILDQDKGESDSDSKTGLLSKLKLLCKKIFNRQSYNSNKISQRLLKKSLEPIDEDEIINNVSNFTDKVLEDIMIPRSNIVSVSIDVSLEELSELIIKHAHTRTLIYQERLDNIVGFIHIKDLFEVIVHKKKFNLRKLLRKHIVSPHSMKLIDLLSQMQKTRTHIAIIVDEYGGTDGLVTIEDIIEEIVGNIDDEHDIGANDNYKIIKSGLIMTSSRVEIEEFERILGIKLKYDGDEFDTIGGLIMTKAGNVPEKGAVINIADNVVAEILESTPRTIKQIKITYIPK